MILIFRIYLFFKPFLNCIVGFPKMLSQKASPWINLKYFGVDFNLIT